MLVFLHCLHLTEKIYLFSRATTKITWPYNWISADTESHPQLMFSHDQGQSRSSFWMNCWEKRQHEGPFHSGSFLCQLCEFGNSQRFHRWVGGLPHISKFTSLTSLEPKMYYISIVTIVYWKQLFIGLCFPLHSNEQDWCSVLASITTSRH